MIQFIGMIQPRQQSEIHRPSGAAIDPAYLARGARAHEAGGFDRVLIGWFSNGPDGLQLAAHAAAHTERLGFLVAHRPGFQAPTTAARAFATLDQLSGGRAAIHVISGGDDSDQRRDGDYLDKDARYARTDEYVGALKAIWSAASPVDHHGEYYRFEGASPEVRPMARIPVYFGGASDAAVVVAGRRADVYALWGETQAQVREITGRVRAEAARHGRSIGFSLSFRPILGATEEAAWARAERILGRIREVRGVAALGQSGAGSAPQNAGSQRLLAAAALGDRPEGRLYTAIARETGARGNTTALVGTPRQVADALLDYHALGVETFLLRGFDPIEDAEEYGASLLPEVRRRMAARAPDMAAAE